MKLNHIYILDWHDEKPYWTGMMEAAILDGMMVAAVFDGMTEAAIFDWHDGGSHIG